VTYTDIGSFIIPTFCLVLLPLFKPLQNCSVIEHYCSLNRSLSGLRASDRVN